MTVADESGWVTTAISTLAGVLTFALYRFIDYVMPKGRHLRWLDRFTVPDKPPPGPEDAEG